MKKIALIALIAFGGTTAFAQTVRPITTGVPFLQIAADARSAGMGDMGVATTTDVFSQQYNPAKYAFATQNQGFAVSYTPYMSKITNDISLAQLNYFNKFNERSAVGASLRYFGMGEVHFRQDYNDPGYERKPNELALDVSYSLKLNENFGMGIAGRFINSNLKLAEEAGGDASSASSFAVDVAGFYESDQVSFNGFDGRWRAGFNFQNLGPKIKYDADDLNAAFLPSNLKLGAGFDFIFDAHNTLTLTTEFNKLLVPTPIKPDNESANAYEKARREYNDIGWFSGVFKSFGDAPDGLSEEFKEITWALGAEYWYDNAFAFRAGYFHESEEKGARKFASLGAGFRYNVVTVDVSYLFSTSKVNNPLENTLRFSLTFNFGNKSYSRS